MISSPHRRRIPLAVLAASFVLVLLGAAGTIASPDALTGRKPGSWELLALAVPVLAFALAGAVIALRLPDNAIGPLLAAIGLLFATVVASSGVSHWALATRNLSTRTAEWISVPSSAWVVALGLIGTQLPLRLPDGELPSPRWRWFSRVTLGLIALSTVAMAITPGRVEGFKGTESPVAVEGAEAVGSVFLLVIGSFLVCIAALVRRFRAARGDERARLRWIAYGGLVFLAVYLGTLFFPGAFDQGPASTANTISTVVSEIAFAALPVSIFYAVRRHGLYDIDVVINRTVVYALLTVTLVGGYLLTVLLAQLVLPARSDLGVAISTLAVAAAFRPVRARIQADVDRRFFRRRYDARRTVQTFTSRLRDQLDLDALDAELRRVVADAVQPAHVSIWLRDR